MVHTTHNSLPTPLGFTDHQPSTTVDVGLDRLARLMLHRQDPSTTGYFSRDYKALILTKKTKTFWITSVVNERQKIRPCLVGSLSTQDWKPRRCFKDWRLWLYLHQQIGQSDRRKSVLQKRWCWVSDPY